MVKHIALVTTRPGMSRDAFIDRYENGHALLALRILPPGTYTDYRRNYVVPGSVTTAISHGGPGAPEPTFNGLSEFWYPDQAAVDGLSRSLAETDVGPQIVADEEALFDRDKITVLTVEEHVTPPDQLAPRPAGHVGPPDVKVFVLIRKRPGMSRADFIDYYEKRHIALARELFSRDGRLLMAGYRRSYPVEDGQFAMPHLDAARPAFDYDVLTEIWYWTAADHAALQARVGEPAIGDALAADEAQLFDRDSITLFHVDEYVTPGADLVAMGADCPLQPAG